SQCKSLKKKVRANRFNAGDYDKNRLWLLAERRIIMKMYIKEYYPYFILLIIINVSILFISYIDPLVPMHALIYIVLINLFITAIAVGIDFNRKKEFYRSIRKLEKHEEIDYLPSERSAFQQDYFDVLRGLKQEYNKMVEIESNRTK